MKEYWLTNSRFKFIAIILFAMWLGFMILYYLKADEITHDPCTICAKSFGENVVCSRGGIIPASRVYYPNGSIVDANNKVIYPQDKINLSKFNFTSGN